MFARISKSPEPRFRLDSWAGPFTIDEYLCMMMDKYAPTRKLLIGKVGSVFDDGQTDDGQT